MSSMRVTILAIFLIYFHGFRVEALGLVEMISDYAKVVKNTENSTKEAAESKSSPTTLPLETATESIPDYQDFDDLQEEDNRALKHASQTETMMKYFNGLVSLLALMYKFNGSFGELKPSKLHFKNQNESKDKSAPAKDDSTGKYFKEAQDRFEFPQKKFRYQENSKDNMIEQQFQPLENYPPYDPLKSNGAESYNQEDKKTSYDADLMHYDLTKNSVSEYNPDVDIQQSYSYEIPYQNSKPAKTPTYDASKDASVSWSNNVHPVYNPWMTKAPTETIHTHGDDYKPWKSKTPDHKSPSAGVSDSRQPWHEKPLDLPIYHHDFNDQPPPDTHHFEYQEIEHPMDEDRVSKKPYSYYFLGRKLWYIPLLFSVYFIIYVGALVLKSVARHKIQFPEKIWNLHDDHYSHGKHRRHRKIDEITEKYESAFENMNNKFM